MRNDLDRMESTLGKVKKPLKKKEEGNKVTYDAEGYAINPDKSIEELTAGTTVLPTANVEAKGKLLKKGKLREAISKKRNTKMEEKYKRAGEFNKYAMETGISPNFDAIGDSLGYQARSDAMTDFYSDKSNVRRMNRLQRQYFRKKK